MSSLDSPPLVSIIIPTYNPGDYLQVAVDSILAQSFTDWELVLIDDGSRPDEAANVARIAEATRQQGARVIFLEQPNRGVSVARNRAMLEAQGKYLAFLDNDDTWAPGKLELQVKMLEENPKIALCHTAFDLIDENGQVSGPGYGCAVTYKQMLGGNFGVLLSSSVIRRSVLAEGGFSDPCYLCAQDLDVFLSLARFHPFGYVPSVETHYRLHGNNASNRYWTTFTEICHLLKKHELWAQSQRKNDIARAARSGAKRIRPTYSGQAFNSFRANRRKGKIPESSRDFRRAVTLSPLSYGAHAGWPYRIYFQPEIEASVHGKLLKYAPRFKLARKTRLMPSVMLPSPDEKPEILQGAIDEALEGETLRSQDWENLAQALVIRRERIQRELDLIDDACQSQSLQAQIEEIAAQIQVLQEEARLSQFVEDTVKFSYEVRRLTDG